MMIRLLTILATSLILSQITTEPSDSDIVPWELSWPFLQSEAASHSINCGYGDWAFFTEGMHPGLDSRAAINPSVSIFRIL